MLAVVPSHNARPLSYLIKSEFSVLLRSFPACPRYKAAGSNSVNNVSSFESALWKTERVMYEPVTRRTLVGLLESFVISSWYKCQSADEFSTSTSAALALARFVRLACVNVKWRVRSLSARSFKLHHNGHRSGRYAGGDYLPVNWWVSMSIVEYC